MSETNVATAEAYYQAMTNKDLDGMAQRLHPDVRLTGPLSNLNGKGAVLEAAKKLLTQSDGVKVHSRFGSKDQVALTYDMLFHEPIGICRTAVLMTFKDGLIAGIELFFYARPFVAA